jgi:hypothetical protein
MVKVDANGRILLTCTKLAAEIPLRVLQCYLLPLLPGYGTTDSYFILLVSLLSVYGLGYYFLARRVLISNSSLAEMSGRQIQFWRKIVLTQPGQALDVLSGNLKSVSVLAFSHSSKTPRPIFLSYVLFEDFRTR